MTTRLMLVLGLFASFACKPSATVEENETVTVEENEIAPEKDSFDLLKQQIGEMVDPTYSESSNFNLLFDCYLVYANGEVRTVSDSAAIASYRKLIKGASDQILPAPVFVIQNTKKVLLVLKEKNVWANVLLDRGSLVILDVQFPPGSKTAQLKDKTKTFEEQFTGSTISFSENNFVLTPWEEETAAGDIQIDGISGATRICQASIDMLNNQLPFYSNFLQNTGVTNTE